MIPALIKASPWDPIFAMASPMCPATGHVPSRRSKLWASLPLGRKKESSPVGVGPIGAISHPSSENTVSIHIPVLNAGTTAVAAFPPIVSSVYPSSKGEGPLCCPPSGPVALPMGTPSTTVNGVIAGGSRVSVLKRRLTQLVP